MAGTYAPRRTTRDNIRSFLLSRRRAVAAVVADGGGRALGRVADGLTGGRPRGSRVPASAAGRGLRSEDLYAAESSEVARNAAPFLRLRSGHVVARVARPLDVSRWRGRRC